MTEKCICYLTILPVPSILLSNEFRALPCLERVGSRPGTLSGTVVRIVHTPSSWIHFRDPGSFKIPSAGSFCSFLCRTSERVRALYSTAFSRSTQRVPPATEERSLRSDCLSGTGAPVKQPFKALLAQPQRELLKAVVVQFNASGCPSAAWDGSNETIGSFLG